MKKIQTCLLALLIAGKIFSQGLNDTEKKIITWVRAHHQDAVSLLEESVNINSGTFNITGVRKNGTLFAKEMEKAGMTTTWVELPDTLKRAGHLVGYRKGSKGKRLLLIGHLDTVFEPDMPFSPFKLINDSIASGQGVNDMKGGNVIIVKALQALEALGLLENTSITAYFTGDEEESGKPTSISRRDFIERAKEADIALGFETAQGMHTIAIGRRGFSSWQLEVNARTAHSAGIFGSSAGYGAIFEAARILNSFRETLSKEKYLTFNPGIIAGGSELQYDSSLLKGMVVGKTNIISPKVIIEGDLRFLTAAQRDQARARMKHIASNNNLAGTKAKIRFKDGIPAMEPLKGNDQLRLQLDKVSKDLGLGPVHAGDPGSRGAGDISYIARYVDCIDGLGASGSGAHTANETINLQQFPKLIERAALLIYRLTR